MITIIKHSFISLQIIFYLNAQKNQKMNMITDINVRKMWKSMRNKCLNDTKKKKVDSDSILETMRSVTDMEAQKLPHSQNKSLEIQRNDDNFSGQYNVVYTATPKTKSRGTCSKIKPNCTYPKTCVFSTKL